jgi:hypothetical protein
MKLEVWFKNASKPRVYEGKVNTYEEGSFVCIITENAIYKYPTADVFRLVEFTKEKDE